MKLSDTSEAEVVLYRYWSNGFLVCQLAEVDLKIVSYTQDVALQC